ncbi:MAG: DUF1573 domain-containing protein [Planctomycetaceae bacterium]
MRTALILAGIGIFLGTTYAVVSTLRSYQTAEAAPSKGGSKPVRPGDLEASSTAAPSAAGKGEVLRATRESYFPEISEKGPWPKAVVDQTEFEFGRMEVGEEMTHGFKIRNEGQAPLELAKGNTTCQCTISELENNLIPPGGEAVITLRWKPTGQSDAFEKGAEIRTNDPNNKVFSLRVVGLVVPRLVLIPDKTWEVREVQENAPSMTAGFLISPVLPDLAVEKLEYDENRLEVKVLPADVDQISSMKGKSGMGFEVTVKPGMPVGAFSFPIRIFTNTQERQSDGSLGGQAVVNVTVAGRREGPIRLIGPAYLPESSTVSLGSFSSVDGRSVKLTILVRGAPEEGLQFTEVKADPESLRLELQPEAKGAGTAKRYTLVVQAPPNGPRLTRRDENPAEFRIRTNHPDAPEMILKVQFTSY